MKSNVRKQIENGSLVPQDERKAVSVKRYQFATCNTSHQERIDEIDTLSLHFVCYGLIIVFRSLKKPKILLLTEEFFQTISAVRCTWKARKYFHLAEKLKLVSLPGDGA